VDIHSVGIVDLIEYGILWIRLIAYGVDLQLGYVILNTLLINCIELIMWEKTERQVFLLSVCVGERQRKKTRCALVVPWQIRLSFKPG
jgi:hypothetical protein